MILFRWVNPPTTAFMLEWSIASRSGDVDYRWVDYQDISPWAPLAVIAAEDQRFFDHNGFDFASIRDAVGGYARTGKMRGASTISQQVAKNLFLWSGRSALRKGLEAALTTAIELTWRKRRILEVYLNVAEMGTGVFGIEAASRRFFRKGADELSAKEAALLAAVLPNPRARRVDAPSAAVLERRAWILGQMRQLGGLDSLRDRS